MCLIVGVFEVAHQRCLCVKWNVHFDLQTLNHHELAGRKQRKLCFCLRRCLVGHDIRTTFALLGLLCTVIKPCPAFGISSIREILSKQQARIRAFDSANKSCSTRYTLFSLSAVHALNSMLQKPARTLRFPEGMLHAARRCRRRRPLSFIPLERLSTFIFSYHILLHQAEAELWLRCARYKACIISIRCFPQHKESSF